MFEPKESETSRSPFGKTGAHYNLFEAKTAKGMEMLRQIFPDATADDLNFALFSTSGVHGSYVTIEEIEVGLAKYGDDPEFDDECPDDWAGNELTFVIVHPRLCCLRYGNAQVRRSDIEYLKKLRRTSHEAVSKIGI